MRPPPLLVPRSSVLLARCGRLVCKASANTACYRRATAYVAEPLPAAQTAGTACQAIGRRSAASEAGVKTRSSRMALQDSQAGAAGALDLVERALPWGFVGPPAQEVRAVAEAIAREM